MTYLVFLLIFVIAPTIVMTVLFRGLLRRRHYLFIAINAVIAVVYTTPWDNYLVATGVWYYDPKLVLGVTLGWVPIEEYSFFILQTFLTGTLFMILFSRFYSDHYVEEQSEL